MSHTHIHTVRERIIVSMLVSVLVLALGVVVATVLRTADTTQLSASLGDILDINGTVQVGDATVSLDGDSGVVDLTGDAGNFTARPGGDGIATIAATNFDDIATEGSLRTAIQNWVNFALGFLALIAMVALVYAGFQYVTARGEDDQVGSAKKSIAYVTLGIIVIFAAWAIVNTLIIFGPQGSDLAAVPGDALTADVVEVVDALPPAYWEYEKLQR